MTCTSCQTPTAEGMHLCIDCVLKLEAILDAAPEMLKEARTTIERMDRISDKGAATRPSGTPPEVLNVECSDRADELEELLFYWARCLLDEADERGVTVGRYGTEYARLLREHTALVRMADWAGDCLAELRRAYRRLVQAVDSPPDVRTYGTCYEPDCGGPIRGAVGEAWARCRACGFAYPTAELTALRLSESWDEPAPLKRVCAALDLAGFPIPHRTMRSWVERGKLVAVGEDERGRPTYTMAALLELRREAA